MDCGSIWEERLDGTSVPGGQWAHDRFSLNPSQIVDAGDESAA